MQVQFDQGDRPEWPVTFTDSAGASFTPTAVTVRVTRPSGSTSTWTQADTVVAIGSGLVTFTFPVLNESGVWRAKMWSTAPNVAAVETSFLVPETGFINP